MSGALSWFRVRGTTSPFSYRIYGPPLTQNIGPISNNVQSANIIYCVPWLTGQGGAIDAIHTRVELHASVVMHWGIYAANHIRLVVPGGLLAATSATAVGAAVQSIALVYSATPNAMHYLAWACNTPRTARAFDYGFNPVYPLLGVDSTGLCAHWGIAASYDVTNGLPAVFPQTGWTFLGQANSLRPPFIGVHYA